MPSGTSGCGFMHDFRYGFKTGTAAASARLAVNFGNVGRQGQGCFTESFKSRTPVPGSNSGEDY